MKNSLDLWTPTSCVHHPHSWWPSHVQSLTARRQQVLPGEGRGCCEQSQSLERAFQDWLFGGLPARPVFPLEGRIYWVCLYFLTKTSHWRQALPLLLRSYAFVFFSSSALRVWGCREHLFLPILNQVISSSCIWIALNILKTYVSFYVILVTALWISS